MRKWNNSTEGKLIIKMQSRDRTHLPSVFVVTNVLVFGAVSDTRDNCVKVNSNTTFQTQKIYIDINQIRVN